MAKLNSAGSSIAPLIAIYPVDKDHKVDEQYEAVGTQTFLAGQAVVMSGGALESMGADASGTSIWGFAADPAAGVTSSKRGVNLALPHIVYCGNIGHATSASAITAATDIGLGYGLTTLSGRTYVDKNKTGGLTRVTVLALDDRDAVGSYYGRVHFVVQAAYCQPINPTNVSGPYGNLMYGN